MYSFYDDQFPDHSNVSSLSEYVTYLEVSGRMHKAVKAFYPEYMFFGGKVELS